jgi:hypothetical protein
VEVA